MKTKYKCTIMILLVLTLSSCSNVSFSTTEKNANNLCKSVQKNEYANMMDCFYNEQSVYDLSSYNFENFKLQDGIILDYINSNNSNINYSITYSDDTKVEVEFEYLDATNIVNKTLDAYLNDVVSKIEAGVSFEDYESIEIFQSYFKQMSNAYQATNATKTITFNYVETSDSNYLIDTYDDDFFDVITSNIFKAYDDYYLSI